MSQARDRLPITELFARFMKERIQPSMKERGFRRKGNSFGKWVENQFLVVNFQTVPEWIQKDPSEYPFTVNLGVFARKLHTFFPYKAVPDFPAESQCHWRERLGGPTLERGDPWRGWWGLREAVQFESLANEILGLLATEGLPLLEQLSTEGGLRDHWLQRYTSGTGSDFIGFQYASILLMRNGPTSDLHRVIDEARSKWRGTEWEATLDDHIQKLGL